MSSFYAVLLWGSRTSYRTQRLGRWRSPRASRQREGRLSFSFMALCWCLQSRHMPQHVVGHGFLEAVVVGQVCRRCRRTVPSPVHLESFTTPVLDMAVDEGEIAALTMPVGWERLPKF